MLKKISDYKEYQTDLKEVERLRIKFENQKKLFEDFERVSLGLENDLGISKIGEQVDFDQITKAEQQSKIRGREMQIADKECFKAEQQLKETILEIKNLRKIEIKKIGRAINLKVLKIIKDIEKLKADYTQLEREIKSDFESLEIQGGYSEVIGADPRHIDFSNPMRYPTEFYLKRSKIYLSKEKEH